MLFRSVSQSRYEASRRLTENLTVRGFAMVPIPSSEKAWGVLVADKGVDGSIITRRDLVSLQLVAQSLGLALDKKAKIDSEVKVRKIFQKYVPSAVVESTLGLQEPKLGGEHKEAICLFLDIRNFTMMASMLPPQILVEMLNDVYALLQKTVSEFGGVIDKFLGDGALVTWGVIPGSDSDPVLAINAAKIFCERLESLNDSLKSNISLKPPLTLIEEISIFQNIKVLSFLRLS